MKYLYRNPVNLLLLLIALTLLNGCATKYPNKDPIGQLFPNIAGESLDRQLYRIPQDLAEEKTLLLIGYKQNAQFDIDRWMIGLDMHGTDINILEIPAIQGAFPRLFKSSIDNGMRSGIPEEVWPAVVTVYKDGSQVQSFTGNEKPGNARVVLLNSTGRVAYFHDRGFSVQALNNLQIAIEREECDKQPAANSARKI